MQSRPRKIATGGGKVVKFPRSGNTTTPSTDDIETRYLAGKSAIERYTGFVMLPFAWLGVAIAQLFREVLGHRLYPLVGGILAGLGVLLSIEAYWVSIGMGKPFVLKPGLDDGATLWALVEMFTSPRRFGTFAFLAGLAVINQVIESLPFRLKSKRSAKSKGSNSWMLWALVIGAYALDFFSVWTTYSKQSLTIPVIIWGLCALFGAELGLALANHRRK